MSEEKKLTFFQEQVKNNPVIEDIIEKHLDDDKKKIALDFVAWLRENKLNPRFSGASANDFNIICKGKSICSIEADGNRSSNRGWRVTPRLDHMETYKEAIMSEGLQDCIWDTTGYCVYSERSPYFGMKKAPGCSPNKPCRGGKDVLILGKLIKHKCYSGQGFLNPDETAVANIKKLLLLERKARTENNKA